MKAALAGLLLLQSVANRSAYIVPKSNLVRNLFASPTTFLKMSSDEVSKASAVSLYFSHFTTIYIYLF